MFITTFTQKKEIKMTRLSLDVTNEFHHKLKLLTAWKGISIKDFVIKALNKQIELEAKPILSKNVLNDETIKVIEDSRLGVDVNSYDSIEVFFKHLDKLQEEVEQELIQEL
jgi:hypothetical protein